MDRITITLRTALVCLGLAAAGPGPAHAAALTLHVGDVQGDGFALHGVRVSLQPDGDAFAGRLSVRRASLPAPAGELHDLALDCPRLRMGMRRLVCENGRLQAPLPGLAPEDARLGLTVHADGRVDLRVAGLRWHDTALDLQAVRHRDGRWTVSGKASLADPSALLALAPLPEGVVLSGQLDLPFSATVHADGRVSARAAASMHSLAGHSADGRHAAEDVGAQLNLAVNGRLDGTLRVTAAARLDRGQVYTEPVFLDFGEHPLRVEIHAETGPRGTLITHLGWHDPGAVSVMARGALRTDGTGALAVERLDGTLPGLYDRYLQPFLLGGPWDALDTAGSVHGRASWADGSAQALQLHVDRVYVRDRRDRLVLSALEGDVNWRASDDAPPTRLRWNGGRLYGLDFGASRLDLQLHPDGVSAPAEQRIAVLDGALLVSGLHASGLGGADAEIGFDARLEPISLRRLSRALGWPQMGGTLAGTLPDARYRDRVITVGGALQVQAFDGAVTVDNLRIEELISPLPRLSADIRLRELDLEQLTGTFEFGRITGRLDGEVLGLRLVDWEASTFDARLYTAADPGRRRISQRAVDNLSSVGGGGALPGLFLSFFEDFRYDRLGLSCRLVNQVCHMDGVAPANGNYYIVRGRGLPRIDVIGTVRRVSWPALLQQLQAVQLDEAQTR